jgi:hypothetical protein
MPTGTSGEWPWLFVDSHVADLWGTFVVLVPFGLGASVFVHQFGCTWGLMVLSRCSCALAICIPHIQSRDLFTSMRVERLALQPVLPK